MIAAEYDGHCDYCDEPIEAGEMIENLSPFGGVHAECAEEEDN